MLITCMALVATAAYLSYGTYLGRKIYRALKIEAFETVKGRKVWEKYQNVYVISTLGIIVTWPAWILYGLIILAGRGIKWVITHNQEIPAEVQEKIDKLEKELGLEDKKPDELAEVEELVTKIVDKHKDDPRTKCPYCYDTYVTSVNHDWSCPYFVPKSVSQKAKAGKGSTVIQVASGNSSNYYSGSNHPSSRDYSDRDYYDLKQSYYDKGHK